MNYLKRKICIANEVLEECIEQTTKNFTKITNQNTRLTHLAVPPLNKVLNIN